MLTIITAVALATAAQAAPAAQPANPHAQHGQAGQADHSKMDHSKMGQGSDSCCKKGADGKMECAMKHKDGAAPADKGHSGH